MCMMNTLANKDKAVSFRDDLEARLDALAEIDVVSSEQLRAHFAETVDMAWTPPENDDLHFVSQWLAENAVSAESGETTITALGSGKTVAALLEMLPDNAHLFIVEEDIAAAARMFIHCRLEDYLRADKLTIALGDEQEYVLTKFFCLTDMAKPRDFKIFTSPDSDAVSNPFYTSTLKVIKERMNINIFNLNTLIYRGPQWQFNTLRNLPVICAGPGVSALSGLFAGKPALVTGAGPSLDSALPFLREVAPGFVILATGTSLRALRNAGIRPDIVVTVDASKKTGAQFETRCDDLFLASSSIAHPPALRKFRGVFTGGLSANPIDLWVDSFREPRGALAAAGTVTASAIDLAIRMGCNQVACVGFDLSFSSDGTTHAGGTMYDRYKAAGAGLVDVPGNYSETVKTSPQFRCYISLMEDYIAEFPHVEFINATFSGARIKGMRVESPDFLRKLSCGSFDSFGEIARVYDNYTDVCSSRIISELESSLEQLGSVFSDAMQSARLCNRIIMLLKSPCAGDEERLSGYLEKLRSFDDKFAADKNSSVLLDMSLWPVSYRTNTGKAENEKGVSEAVFVNKRSRELYEQIAGAAKWTRDLLENVVEEMKNQMKGASDAVHKQVS